MSDDLFLRFPAVDETEEELEDFAPKYFSLKKVHGGVIDPLADIRAVLQDLARRVEKLEKGATRE